MTRQGEDGPALAIIYKEENNLFHSALLLTGSPVPPGPTEAASREAFEKHVDRIITGGLDRRMNLVENSSLTRAEGTTTYFKNMYHSLDRKAYLATVRRLKEEFPASDPWVQALPGPLGVLMKVRGGTGYGAVEVVPEVIAAGPFKYPHP